jgi:hypothetical protein
LYEEEKRRTNALLFRFFSKLLDRYWHKADVPRRRPVCPLSGNSGHACSRGFDRVGRE